MVVIMVSVLKKNPLFNIVHHYLLNRTSTNVDFFSDKTTVLKLYYAQNVVGVIIF